MTELNIKYYEFLFNVKLNLARSYTYFTGRKIWYISMSIPTKEDNDHIVSEECKKIIKYLKNSYDTDTQKIKRTYWPKTCSWSFVYIRNTK
jgi:hypothetical protein